MNESLSKERLIYLRRQKRKKLIIIFSRIALLILLIGMWELLAQLKIINTFITSSPSRVAACFLRLIKDGTLFLHLSTSVYETLAGFLIGTVLGLAIAGITKNNAPTIASITQSPKTFLIFFTSPLPQN